MDEQKLNDLISEISRLIDTIKKTSGQTATSGSVDAANDRLVRAIGLLAAKMDKTAITEENSIKKFVKAVDSATQAVKKQADAIDDIVQDEKARNAAERDAHNQSIKQEIDANRLRTSSSREVFNAAKSMGSGLNQLNNSFLNLGGSSNAANAGLQLLSAGFGGVTKAITGYASSLQRGERGAKLSGQALEDLATPILDTVSTLGTLAMILPGVGKLFGKGASAAASVTGKFSKLAGATAVASAEIGKFGIKIVKEGLNQVDNLFDSFQKLSASGIAGAGGMDDVFGMLQEIGMTSGEISKFNSLIAGSAQSIKFLGATATDGAKEFTKVAGGLYKGKLGQQLQMLGVTQEEMNKLALTNMSIQARTGQLEKLSTEQRIASTAKFVKELDMAAQLTGATREQQAEAREAALADERFRAAIASARAKGDEKEIARLERAQSLAATAKLAGDAEGATGILQLAASGGAMTTKAATAAEMTYGINAILDSNLSNNDAVAQMAKTGEASLRGLADTNKLIGTIEGYQTNIVGSYNLVEKIMPAILAAQKQGISLDEFLKNQQEERTRVKTDETGAPTKDNTRLMVDAARMQQNAALIMDKSLYELSAASTIHSAATKMFEGAVAQFGKIVGTMPKSQVETGGADVKAAIEAAQKASDARMSAENRKISENVLKSLPGGSGASTSVKEDVAQRLNNNDGIRTAERLHKMIMNFFGAGMATGGIAKGPDSGHLQLLHGTEAVIPLKGGSIPLQILGGGSGIESGPVFNPQTETNSLLEKNNKELTKAVVTLDEILLAITGGAAVTGGGTAGLEKAMDAHDASHKHEPPTITPDAAKELGKGLGSPLENLNVTSGFGMRTDPFTGKQAGHGGVDLAGKLGDIIKAPEGGTARVRSEKESGGYGNVVEILDANGKIMHRMAHMSEMLVKTGDKIEAGAQIGKVGSTGRSTGAHLHWEQFDPKTGLQIDPIAALAAKQGKMPGFGSTAGGAATGNPNIASQGRRAGATQYPAPAMSGDVKGNLDMMTKALKEQGITDPKMINATLANVMKETGGKINVEEDLAGYANTSNERIRKIFGARAAKKSDKELDAIKKDPRQFAEMMYGKDSGMGLGNTEEGDAYKYRGRGAVGLTGKANYAAASKDLFGDDRLVKDPELLKDPEMAAKTSAWFMKKNTGAMAKRMGMAGGPQTQEQADLLATSTIAGQVIKPGQGFLGTEALGKVSGYSAQLAGGQMPAGAPVAKQPTTQIAGGQMPAGAPTAAQPAAQGSGGLLGMLGGMLGFGGATAPGQPTMAGVPAGGAPGAIGTDISAITQALQAQTAATQSAITTGMQDLTTRLVDKIGPAGEGGGTDPAVPTLLSDILAASRDQTSAINRLIQVQTS